MTGNPSPGVLYILVCGSPMARDVGILVDLAQQDGWEVCVVTTPDGRKFVDVAALQGQFTSGFHAAFIVCAIIAGIGILTSLVRGNR